MAYVSGGSGVNLNLGVGRAELLALVVGGLGVYFWMQTHPTPAFAATVAREAAAHPYHSAQAAPTTFPAVLPGAPPGVSYFYLPNSTQGNTILIGKYVDGRLVQVFREPLSYFAQHPVAAV